MKLFRCYLEYVIFRKSSFYKEVFFAIPEVAALGREQQIDWFGFDIDIVNACYNELYFYKIITNWRNGGKLLSSSSRGTQMEKNNIDIITKHEREVNINNKSIENFI